MGSVVLLLIILLLMETPVFLVPWTLIMLTLLMTISGGLFATIVALGKSRA